MTKRGFLFSTLVLTTLIVVLFLLKIPQKLLREESLQTPIALSKKILFGISPTRTNPQKSLNDVVENSLLGTEGTYGIAIKNLKTKESYYKNEHRTFESASLYKLWVMATVFDQLQKGLLHEDDILSQNVQTLNDKFQIATENAELTDGVITLRISEALNKMITISDNYAALLLSEKVKLATVRKFLINHALTESTLGVPPQTTAGDIALFLEKLYNAELANSTYSEEMIDLLKNQSLNNKLPKYLPENVVIAHKTGELGSVTHDAGIVFGGNGDYVLVILSQSDTPRAAEERIAGISKSVYDYFEIKR